MASLMEELIATLEEEEKVYSSLIPVAQEKTKAIIANDLTLLQTVTEQEQEKINQGNELENKRQSVVDNIGIVLSKDSKSLTLKDIVEILHNQPEEQRKLQAIHDKLNATMKRLKDVNGQNKELIEASLEMIEFNMNVLRSTRMSSGSSNYTRNASEMAEAKSGIFDAKQ